MTHIVAMTRAHIPLLMVHERAMFGAESWSADAYRDELADRRDRYYIVVLGPQEQLLGWAGVRVIDAEAEILTVGVVPDARRQGIGTSLVTALLEECRMRGAYEIFLDVRVDNDSAQRLYEREGFTRLGLRRGYYEHGRIDALTMVCRLEPKVPA